MGAANEKFRDYPLDTRIFMCYLIPNRQGG